MTATGTGGALAGLRVIDTATLYAGPFITTLLADHGADVVKIEPPGGAPYRHTESRMWPLLARNKKSVVADLRAADGAALVRALAAESDVLVVNMPTKLLLRVELDYETLAALNPDVVYVHVTGFGANGDGGQYIDVNPLDAMLHAVGPVLTAYRPGGEVPGRLGSGMQGNPLRGVFATCDGWVVVGASTPRHVREIFALAGYDAEAPDADLA